MQETFPQGHQADEAPSTHFGGRFLRDQTNGVAELVLVVVQLVELALRVANDVELTLKSRKSFAVLRARTVGVEIGNICTLTTNLLSLVIAKLDNRSKISSLCG